MVKRNTGFQWIDDTLYLENDTYKLHKKKVRFIYNEFVINIINFEKKSFIFLTLKIKGGDFFGFWESGRKWVNLIYFIWTSLLLFLF